MARLRTTGATVAKVALDLAEQPWRAATRLVPGRERQQQAVEVVDGVAATARRLAGSVLRDPDLEADGRRRALALEQRRRAADLRDAAQARREAAEEAADEEQAAIEDLREERLEAHEEAAERRELQVAEARTARSEVAETRAKRARLAAVEDETEALDAQAEALAEDEEARRLAAAAARTKAARKRTG
jgi:fused signal recognition particle receptor